MEKQKLAEKQEEQPEVSVEATSAKTRDQVFYLQTSATPGEDFQSPTRVKKAVRVKKAGRVTKALRMTKAVKTNAGWKLLPLVAHS